MMELIQPYVETIVQAVIGVLVAAVLGAVAVLKGKVSTWLEARTTVQQREILHRLAQEASALAESAYISGGGPQKLQAAIDYVNERTKGYGIELSLLEIQAAVEKAVQDYNKAKQQAAAAVGEQQ